MSYRIEYQWTAFAIAGAPLGLAEDRYVIAIEGGDNNVYDRYTSKRSRDWEACMVGTRNQVLRQAVKFSGACESGCLKPHGQDCTPERYIRRIRRLLDSAKEADARGHWRPRLRAAADHPAVAELRQLGLEPRQEQRYGVTSAVIEVPGEHLGAYFQVIDRHVHALQAWCWISVSGLPRS